MKELLAGLTVLMVLGALASSSVGQSKQRNFVESISPSLKDASLRLANVSRFETEDSRKITWKELFDRIELDISEIDKSILAVQMSAPPNHKKVTDPAVEYMRATQDLLRALRAKYKASLSLTLASERTQNAAHEATASSDHLFGYKVDALMKADKERKKAAVELSESVTDVASSVKALKVALAHIFAAARFSSNVLIEPAILEALAKKNEPKAGDEPQPKSSLVEELLAPPTAPDAGAAPAAAVPAPWRTAKPSKVGKKPKNDDADPFQ